MKVPAERPTIPTEPTTSRRASGEGTHLRGIAMVTAAFVILPMLDGISKFLVADYHVAQLVWVRLSVQSVVVVVWLALSAGLPRSLPERPGLVVLCAALVWLANFPIVASLAHLPLADASALVMTAPLLLTALSALILRESVGMHRWVAVVVGFAGALVIIRPGLGVFHWAAALPLLTAAFFAVYQIGIRSLSTVHGPRHLLLYSSVLPALASSVLVPFFWVTPDLVAAGLMILTGVGAGLGHYLLIAALRHAPASLLAPFMYIQIVSSTLFGLAVFGDFPDALTFAGAALIIAAGIHGMRRAWLREEEA